jgi:hypothetical protein
VGLFLVAFAVFVKYNRLIFRLPNERVSIEQRSIQVLSVVTLTFNDQLYFISIISPNPFSYRPPYAAPSSAPSSCGTSWPSSSSSGDFSSTESAIQNPTTTRP